MRIIKDKRYIKILIILSIPMLLIGQYYLFKFGVLKPMVKGVEVEIVDGEYIRDIDKYIVKLDDTLQLSKGDYITIPSYAKDPNIWFTVLDDTGILEIKNEKELVAIKEGVSSIGIMKGSRVLKKATIKVVDPKIENFDMIISDNLEYVGDSSKIESVVQVDYSKFKDQYKVTYESSNEDVLKIEGNEVKAVGVGTAKVYGICKDKKIEQTYNIKAKIVKIDIEDSLEIEVEQTKKLKPKIITSPKGLKHPKVKYELLGRKLSIARAISLDENTGTIKGIREGEERVRITCDNKEKIVKIKVVKESITNEKVQNLEYIYEIIDGKVKITLTWDYLKGVYEYNIYTKNNSLGEDYKVYKTVKNEKTPSNRISTTIEFDLINDEIPNIDIYVVGKTKSGETKPSNIVSIKPEEKPEFDISKVSVQNASAVVDNENKKINITWDLIDSPGITYRIFLKDNIKGETEFILYKDGIEGNGFELEIPEGELNLDLYIDATLDGKNSQSSNIINIK